MSVGSRSRHGGRTSVPFDSTTLRASGGAARKRAVTRAALEALEVRGLLTTFPVTTMVDGGAGSWRAAIIAANAAAGPDIVTVPAGTYTLSNGGANEDACATGDLDITGQLTITGAGSATAIIQAGTTHTNRIHRRVDGLGHFPLHNARG